MNRFRIHQGTAAAGLLLLTSIIGLLAISIGLNLSTNVPAAYADAPSGTISASVDGTTVNLSGSWDFDACKPKNEKKVVGFGIFIDGNDPSSDRSLDTEMHLPADQIDSGTPGQVPCTNDTGTWSDSHELAPGEHQVCVVFYDPHIDKKTGLLKTSGSHSDKLTGEDRNTDNSFQKNGEVICVAVTVPPPPPEVETESPTAALPEAAPPTPTPTPAALGISALPEGGGLPPEGGGSLLPLLYILSGATAIVVVAATARRWRLSAISTRVIGTRDGQGGGWTWGSGT